MPCPLRTRVSPPILCCGDESVINSAEGADSLLPVSSPPYAELDDLPGPSAAAGLWAPQAAPRVSSPLLVLFNFDPVTVRQEPEVPDPSPRIGEFLTLIISS
uniref:Uncharacterized protein n=1 Tax=Cacopsylla melanoneura TaxID=428564 RepID=A0A8D8XN67_9HEMI